MRNKKSCLCGKQAFGVNKAETLVNKMTSLVNKMYSLFGKQAFPFDKMVRLVN